MKKICIIGGSGGLGSQIAKHLNSLYDNKWTDEGNVYTITALSSKDLDIRDFKKCQEFFSENEFDVLINASGVNHDRMIHKLEQKDQYMINYLLDVNIHGTINAVSTILPGMRERGYGRIILLSSVLSTKNIIGTSLYSGCKAFIDRFTKSAAIENISKNVTVNSIQLGYFDGGLTYKLPDPARTQKELPLKRFGTIEELCSTIEYIIENEYLTGTNLPLNGGIC